MENNGNKNQKEMNKTSKKVWEKEMKKCSDRKR